MKIYIKNMVCPRCIISVESLLQEMGIPYSYVKLGEATLNTELDEVYIEKLDKNLKSVGFKLLSDPTSKLIDEIKRLLIEKISKGIEEHFSISTFLKTQIFKDYSSISKLFSQVEGVTLEQYFILQKIEKAKEYLIYNEMSLNQIADRLGYSSSQHLSNQFKKVTGMTPSAFKTIGNEGRKSIDNVH